MDDRCVRCGAPDAGAEFTEDGPLCAACLDDLEAGEESRLEALAEERMAWT